MLNTVVDAEDQHIKAHFHTVPMDKWEDKQRLWKQGHRDRHRRCRERNFFFTF